MIDCIASYHLNPWTCGIAKFNGRLAKELRLPVVPVMALEHSKYQRPLISVNPAEFSRYDRAHLTMPPTFDLFLHGFDPDDALARRFVTLAHQVWAGNTSIATAVNVIRCDAELAWCPGTIPMSDRELPADICVLTFGMAHKLDITRYRRLRELLEAQPQSYQIEISTALHERTPWEDALPELEAELRELFNGKVRLLGNLSDAAMSQALTHATALAAFFPDGVRANNTTVWAAFEHGCPVITNLDHYSPVGFLHGETVFDLDELREWPRRADLQYVRAQGWALMSAHTWKALATRLVS